MDEDKIDKIKEEMKKDREITDKIFAKFRERVDETNLKLTKAKTILKIARENHKKANDEYDKLMDEVRKEYEKYGEKVIW